MSDDPKPTPPGAGNGGAIAGSGVGNCPCPSDFDLSVLCRIVKVSGGTLTMTASDQPGSCSSNYAWTTSSSKISLGGANTGTVTVTALNDVSTSRDAETITVTRSQTACGDLTKTVNVTVARVTFLPSANQRYGFDDYDTPANHDDDHLSVKRGDHTFVRVLIEGGASTDDFNFETRDATKAAAVAPAAGQTDFDLRIDGGATDKAATTLEAKSRCPSHAVFRAIDVHTYKERLVNVVVAKIYDSTSASTNLAHGNADYASHEATINGKVKEAVSRFNITNFDAANAKTNVRFDLDGNGAVSYDIASNGGRELTAISTAITGARTTDRIRIAIIKDLRSFYYLSARAVAGSSTLTVRGSTFYQTGSTLQLGTGAIQEGVQVSSNTGTTLTLAAALAHDHAAGEPLEYTAAAGWSTDPILIEEDASLTTTKWTMAHEAGHRAEGLRLTDIDDQTDFMHYNRSWTDYRLRYCPRNVYRGGGTENQWETIPR